MVDRTLDITLARKARGESYAAIAKALAFAGPRCTARCRRPEMATVFEGRRAEHPPAVWPRAWSTTWTTTPRPRAVSRCGCTGIDLAGRHRRELHLGVGDGDVGD